MSQNTHIYLFGDQTYDINTGLRDLVVLNNDPILSTFFERAYHALRTEVGRLSQTKRQEFQRFSSLGDLLALRRESQLHPALDQALTCTYQLGSFISLCSKNGGSYPEPSESYLVGLCTGALAAAAVSSCRTLSELLPAAVHTIAVAFLTGLCAVDVGRGIEQSLDVAPAPWSMIFSGLSVETASQALAEFSQYHHLPSTSQPFVSASSDHGVTISGPPSVLGNLRKSQGFAKYSAIQIPIYAPYHAPHLFSKNDVESILEHTSAELWSSHSAHLPIVSCASGKLIWAGNFRSLLQVALSDLLLEPLRWEKIVQGVASIARTAASTPIIVHPICTTAAPALRAAFGQSGNGPPDPRDHDYNLSNGLPPLSVEPNTASTSPAPSAAHGRSEKSKIAIIGMSGRFPEAEDPMAFWNLLYQGLDVHKVVPPLHWDAKTHVDLTGERKNTSATPYGCWLNNPGSFDAKFFNMSPREAPQVDPAQRIALLTAYEAIEQAGIVPEATPSTQKDRVGVFYGVTSNDWMETNSAQNIDTYFIPGGNRAFIPGRINYFFKFSGPSYSVDTACSSSLAAIHVACNSLWRGDIDTAIAGGTNVLTNPDFTAGLDRGHFLSRTGNCKTFDDSADGYCRGEGVGTVILKRLEDAIADKDPIQGLILGAYTNHSAEAESITRPHVGAQKAIFGKILNGVGIDPYDVSYVEMHGTGTQAGDAGEMQSVLETFAPASARHKRQESQSLYLGSAKANIGHGEAASGVTSLAKVLLMMKHNMIPPHCGIKTNINHKFPTDLRERGVYIATKPTQWSRPKNGGRRVFLNNFSAAGGNSALLLEDAPLETKDDRRDPRSCHLVAVSAKCAASLKGNVESLLSFIDGVQHDQLLLPSLSYTTTARRIHHPHRIMVSGSDLPEISLKLHEAIDRKDGMTRSKTAPKIAFVFTGQGSQYPGMGRQLFDSFSSFRSDLCRFDQLAQSQGFPPFRSIFTATGGDIGDYTPLIVQLATVCLEMALARLWASWGIVPHSVVGHSLGEYAALNVAGVLSDSDCIYLVGKRAQLLQEKCNRGTHSMLAVRVSTSTIKRMLAGKKYEIACINGPEDVVLSGRSDDIQEIQKILANQHLKTNMLKVPYAFHSSQVDPILGDFQSAAQGVTFREPTIPVICPLGANVVNSSGTFGPKYLSSHCRKPVDMLGAIHSAKDTGVITDKTFIIEIGPHPVVSGMVKAALGSHITALPSLQRNKDSWPLLTLALSMLYKAGTDVMWREYHRDFRSSHTVLQLPAYSWDLKEYWMQYVNDWSLRKGNPVPELQTQSSLQTIVPKLETTTIHKVIDETVNEKTGFITVESDIARSDLNPLVQGHKVNGIPLCTPSVYGDIALTLGTYLLDRYQPTMKERLIDVSAMTIEKALIAQRQGPKLLRTIVEVDWAKKSALCRFQSVDATGKKTAQHAHCTIRFKDSASELRIIQANAAAVKARMVALRNGLEKGKTFRFNQSMIYKMVGTLAQFDPNYRGLKEIVLDSEAMEACSIVGFTDVKKGGTFYTHPAYIDALSQLGGFVMNANDKSDLDVEVFVNHGWGSFQLFGELSTAKAYQTHVRMFEKPGKMWEGDVTVFDGDNVVARFGGVVLQGVPRRVLHYILATQAKTDTQHKEPKLAPSPAKATTRPISSAPQVPLAPGKQSLTTKPHVAEVKDPHATKTETPTPTKIVVAKVQQQVVSHVVVSALQIISEESGIAAEELTDNSVFADMGVDSLLTLIIAGRFKDELELDIDSSAFLNLPTVKDLKEFLNPASESALVATAPGVLMDEADLMPLPSSQPERPIPNTSAQSTIEVQSTPEVILEKGTVGGEEFAQALEIISEESGVAVAELTDDSVFSDIGVDSLLSLIIVGRFRDELSMDFATDASMFADLPTVKDLRDRLTGSTSAPNDEAMSSSSSNSDLLKPAVLTPENERAFDDTTPQSETSANSYFQTNIKAKQRSTPIRPATSTILQGRPRTDLKTLFLFADGGGSAFSYAKIPRVNPDLAIIGISCPYVRHPEEMTCTFDEIMESYLTEIRRRQPKGPYSFGGWSSGGILAYRAAQLLIQEGEEVQSLVLIDSPEPTGLDKVSQRFYDHCNTIGIFGQAMPGSTTPTAPKWLIPHFNATIDMLHEYHATPLPEGLTPKTSLIWAAESVIDGVKFPKLAPAPDDTEGMKFLTEQRTDFSARRWAEFFPGDEVVVEVAEGAHHFSMMQGEHAKRLAEFIDRATK